MDEKYIAIFISDLSGGGAEKMMVNLSHGLVQEGYRVDFIVAHKTGSYFDFLPRDVRLVDLGCKDVLKAFGKLAKYLRTYRPYALLSALNQPNTVAVVAKKIARVDTRIVISLRNTLSVESKSLSQLKHKLMPLIARAVFPHADGIISVGDDSAVANAEFLGLAPTRVKPAYNPVVTPTLLEKAKEPLDEPWLQPGQPPVLLGVGRLTKQKNFSLMVRAFAEVKKVHQSRLMILGEGELKEALVQEATELGVLDDLKFVGFTKNPYHYMANARVFVLASNWEGLPGALIEAMACGTPVVSVDCPSGPREVLENGKYGKLVPMEDVDALSKALIEELNGPKMAPHRESFARFQLEDATKSYLKTLLDQPS